MTKKQKKVVIIVMIIGIIQILCGIYTAILASLYLLGKITDFYPCMISLLVCVIVTSLNTVFHVIISRKN